MRTQAHLAVHHSPRKSYTLRLQHLHPHPQLRLHTLPRSSSCTLHALTPKHACACAC